MAYVPAPPAPPFPPVVPLKAEPADQAVMIEAPQPHPCPPFHVNPTAPDQADPPVTVGVRDPVNEPL